MSWRSCAPPWRIDRARPAPRVATAYRPDFGHICRAASDASGAAFPPTNGAPPDPFGRRSETVCMTMVFLRSTALTGPASRRRRPYDAALALGLLFVLAPLLALVAGALRLEGGPALVRETRRSRAGQRFPAWRYRTATPLAAVAPGAPAQAMGARPSRIGEWVRALGLADLPLLANVARGDLSLADALECLAGDG